MSKDTITVNMNVYDIPIVVEQLNKLQQENKILKTLLMQDHHKIHELADVIDEIKGIAEEANYLANKIEIVNQGNIELYGVIDRLCLILRKIEILDKAEGSEEDERT